MSNRGKLKGKKARLLKDLKTTTLWLTELGVKYGVSRQRIHQFVVEHKAEIGKRPFDKRRVAVHGHRVYGCKTCQRIIKISKQNMAHLRWSIGMIREEMGLIKGDVTSHVRCLRKARLIPEKFARIESTKIARAYRVYLTKRIPVRTIGRMFGLKNFASLIRKHRDAGFEIPEALFKYTSKERSRRLKRSRSLSD